MFFLNKQQKHNPPNQNLTVHFWAGTLLTICFVVVDGIKWHNFPRGNKICHILIAPLLWLGMNSLLIFMLMILFEILLLVQMNSNFRKETFLLKLTFDWLTFHLRISLRSKNKIIVLFHFGHGCFEICIHPGSKTLT